MTLSQFTESNIFMTTETDHLQQLIDSINEALVADGEKKYSTAADYVAQARQYLQLFGAQHQAQYQTSDKQLQ